MSISEEIVNSTKNLPAVKFEHTSIDIYDDAEDRWVTANQVADAAGQARRTFRKLCNELIEKTELKELRHFKYLSLDTGRGVKDTLVLSYRGVIRVMFRSNAPKAQEFRDWAEEVLMEVMLTGRYDIRDHIFTEQDSCHNDINILRQLIADDPERAQWAYKSMHERWIRYEHSQMVPRAYVTDLTPGWFKQTYGAERWSKDAVQEFWPELAKTADFEKYRKSCGLPRRNALNLAPETALLLFRDHIQFGLSVDSLVRKYKYYSRDAIRKALKRVEKHVVIGMEANKLYNVDRYSREKYQEYLRNSKEWDEKKHLMLYPTGPFNLCWECLRPISLATGILHHLTYDRLGHEIWQDFEPVCSTCHAYLHPEKSGVKGENPNGVVTIQNVRVIRQNSTGVSMACDIGGESKLVPHFAIQGSSQITKSAQAGDHGTLVMLASIARQNGILS